MNVLATTTFLLTCRGLDVVSAWVLATSYIYRCTAGQPLDIQGFKIISEP